jgi:uncharacterized delta-60 repeat protein
MFMKKIIVSCTLFVILLSARAQTGLIDFSYGRQGIAKADAGTLYNYNTSASQVFKGENDKLYVVINSSSAGTVVSRRLWFGGVDSTYGLDGYSRSLTISNAVAALQADGKMVLAGTRSGKSPAIVRLKNDGKKDNNFGDAGFREIGFTPTAIAVQADGKIVVAGFYVNDGGFVTARYNEDGSTDDSFNGGDPVFTAFSYEVPGPFGSSFYDSGTPYAIALQADGKIIVAGDARTNDYTGARFALVRYNSDGSTDNSFDDDGKQTTAFDVPGQYTNARAYAASIQADGKIVLAGYVTAGDGAGFDFALARYNTDGSPDNNFDEDGSLTTPVGSDVQVFNALAIDANNKILVAGYGPGASGGNDFVIACYNSNGSPDNSFGSNGKVITDFENSDDYGASLTLLADGKIVAAGYAFVSGNSLFALARYNTNGTLDTSFDYDGKYFDKSCHCYTQFFASAVQTDGKLVAAGKSWNGTDFDFTLVRFTTEGQIDESFNGNGKRVFDFGGFDEIRSLTIQADGKILVAGNTGDYSSVGVLRYNSIGTRDRSFGVNGEIKTAFGQADIIAGIALQADGKIIIAGTTIPDLNTGDRVFFVARYNSDGTPDLSFGDNGKQFTGFGPAGQGTAKSVLIQPDGKIVVTGQAYIDGQQQIVVARYNNDGSLDTGFDGDGKVNVAFGSKDYIPKSAALQPNGKIVIGGYTQDYTGKAEFMVVRFNADGSIDNNFGSNGITEVDMGAETFNLGNALAIAPNGKIAIGGTNGSFALAILNTDGSLFTGYNGSGKNSTEVGLDGSSIQSLVFGGGYLYGTGWGIFPQYAGVAVRYLLADFGPLPVTLLNFKARLQGKKVQLQWQTENELELAGYEVQRSNGNNYFSSIGYVRATGNNNYLLADETPLTGTNLYRLKLLDKDGKFTYSKTIAINQNNKQSLQIAPNPVNSVLYINSSSESSNAVISIFDASGRRVAEQKLQLTGNTPLNVSSLPRGMYSLQVKTTANTETIQFTKY